MAIAVVSWVLMCAATKEVAALLPIVVFLYDQTFVSGNWRAAWRCHGWFHAALATTWLPLFWLILGTGGDRGGPVGFNIGVSWVGYWLTQFEAIARYLALAVWPHLLAFDYGKVSAPSLFGALLWAGPVVLLGFGTLIAL